MLGKLKLTDHTFTRPVPLFLLAYLAYEGGQHDRRDLAHLFWPEQPLDESCLTPLAQDIVAHIEKSLQGHVRSSVTLSVDQLTEPDSGLDRLIHEMAEAHNSLKLHGFIMNAGITSDHGRSYATYDLTPAYLLQLAGAPLSQLSRNKLRNALHKLRSLGKSVILEEGQHVHATIDTDLSALRQALDSNDVEYVLKRYRPFLDNVEALLTASQYEIGPELTLWLSEARCEVARDVQVAYLADARQQLASRRFEQAERRVLAALDAIDEQTLSDEAYNVMLDVLVAGKSPRVSEALERIRALGVPYSLAADLHEAEERLKLHSGQRIELSSDTAITNLSADFINLKTWQISSSHLSSLINVEAYDENGNVLSHEESEARKYSEDLFVPPRESEVVERFLRSDKRAVVLVGKSGSGKTNLLCHSFLTERRNGNLTLFLNARLLHGPDLIESLKTQVLGRICDGWQESFQPLDEWLGKAGKKLLIYLDAVNEYNAGSGPMGLLESVISFVEDANIFSNVKLIVTCRTETWREFKEVVGNERPLRNTFFQSKAGDAITVSGFGSEENRKRLFQKYQSYYELYPARYEAHSDSFRQLIKMPFMMSVIAETYANRGNTGTKNKIPRDLDYLRIFQHMTDRKLREARHLLHISEPKRDLFDYELQACLFGFAQRVYQKLMEQFEAADSSRQQFAEYDALDRSDAVGADLLGDPDFQRFFEPFSQMSSISVFGALVQLNLIEETTAVKHDFWGNRSEIKGYKFYHDQYTQYWLSAVLYRTTLGRVSSETFAASKGHLEAIGDKVADLLVRAKNAPLLVGAVEYWLYSNMTSATGVRDYLVVLFDHLAAKRSGLVSYYAGMFLHGLIEKNVTTARKLYEALFAGCGQPLKQALAYTYLELWPEVTPDDFKAFLEALGAEDTQTIRIAADIFADLYLLDPTRVIDFLDGVLYSSDKALNFLTTGLLKRQSFTKQLTFVVQLALKSFHYSLSSGRPALPLRDFLVCRYNYLIQALVSKEEFGLKAQLKTVLYRKLEESGIEHWSKAAGSQGNNNMFFVEDDGVVQRDVLFDYYKYIVALHNGNYDSLSLRENQEFKELTLQMLTFRPGSVVGYVAIMVAAVLSANKEDHFDLLLEELLDHDTAASRFSIGTISTTTVLINKRRAGHILKRLRCRFVPHQISFGLESEEVLNSFISVAAVDLDTLGGACQSILDLVLEAIAGSHNPERAAKFGDRLTNCNFHPDIEVSKLVVNHLLARNCLEDEFWKDVALRVMAGMLARNPKVLVELLAANGKEAGVLEEVRQHLDDELLLRKDEVNYQMSWNRFFASGWSSTELRYYLVKILLGGLVQSNCVEEFVREYRRFFVEVVKGYLMGEGSDYTRLSVKEALLATEATRRVGQGKIWTPKETD